MINVFDTFMKVPDTLLSAFLHYDYAKTWAVTPIPTRLVSIQHIDHDPTLAQRFANIAGVSMDMLCRLPRV